jgi:hypothetical protein
MPIILKDGSEYEVPRDVLDYFKRAYPEIDVYRELKKMEAWCFSNDQKRKTKRGIKKFINSWLNSALENSKQKPVVNHGVNYSSAHKAVKKPETEKVTQTEEGKQIGLEALRAMKSSGYKQG